MLLLHCVKQFPHTYFEFGYNTLQRFGSQIWFLEVEVFVAMSLLSLRKTYKKYLHSSLNQIRQRHSLLMIL